MMEPQMLAIYIETSKIKYGLSKRETNKRRREEI